MSMSYFGVRSADLSLWTLLCNGRAQISDFVEFQKTTSPPPPTETAFSVFLRQDKENFWQTVTFQLINSNLRCRKTFLRVDDIQYGFVIKVVNQIDQDSSGTTLPQECKKSAQLHSVDQRFFVETGVLQLASVVSLHFLRYHRQQF